MAAVAVEGWRGAGAAAARVLGFGLLQAWTYAVFFSNLVHFSQDTGFGHLTVLYACWCAGVVAMSLASYVLGRKGPRAGGGEGRAGARSIGGARARLVAAGTAAAAVASLCTGALALTNGSTDLQGVCYAASVAAGMAVCVLFQCWGAAFTASIGRYMAVCLGGACAAGGGLYVLAHFCPAGLGLVLVVAMPLLSAACLPAASAGRSGAGLGDGRPATAHGRSVFVRAVVAVALVGFAESFMRAVFQSVGVVSNSFDYQWVMLASSLVAGAFIMAVARFRPGRDSVGRVNYAVMVVILVLFLLAPAVYGLGYAADVATTTCFCLFYLFVWTALLQITAFYRLGVGAAFGVGLGAAYLGCLVGSFGGARLSDVITGSYRLQIVCALACALLVLVAILFVADERTFVELLDADDENPATPRRFALRCERVAQLYGLTPKETEVMTLVAKGRSAQRIQEALGVSASTVNTHVNHIYRKMDVHSRQEMLDLLERDA